MTWHGNTFRKPAKTQRTNKHTLIWHFCCSPEKTFRQTIKFLGDLRRHDAYVTSMRCDDRCKTQYGPRDCKFSRGNAAINLNIYVKMLFVEWKLKSTKWFKPPSTIIKQFLFIILANDLAMQWATEPSGMISVSCAGRRIMHSRPVLPLVNPRNSNSVSYLLIFICHSAR